MDFAALLHQCAPDVHPTTMAAVVRVESGYNPFAIGVVGGRLERQPRSKAEAISTARALEDAGWNFSVGHAQVNRGNLGKYGLTYETAFEPCPNLRVGAAILKECYARAAARIADRGAALGAALSCYYSGNFSTGLRPGADGKPSYVAKVLASARSSTMPPPIVPAPPPKPDTKVRDKPTPGREGGLAAAPIPAKPMVNTKHAPRASPSEYDGFSVPADAAPNPYDGFAQHGPATATQAD